MHLIIVESPVKATTIKRFLTRDYTVKSSYGHMRDLPSKELGVDVKKDFKPKYIIPDKAKKKAQELRKLAKEADSVILASVDYEEPVLIQCPDNLIRQTKIGAFIDNALEKKLNYSLFKILAFDHKTHKISFKRIKKAIRHNIKEPLLEIVLNYGRRIKITASHSVFTKDENGKIKLVYGKNLKVGDELLVPVKLPTFSQKIKKIDLLEKIYQDKKFRNRVFINSSKVSQYQKEKILAPKNGDIPQFQPRLIFSYKLRKMLKNKREENGWSQNFLATKIDHTQSQICCWENGTRNPTLSIGKKYLSILDYNFQSLLNREIKIAPSSIEMAIRNALENQWRDSRKSLTHTFQPLNRFSWNEIKENFKNDKELEISRHNHLHLMPRFIPVNKELMLFLGFFVAEGSYLQNAAKFSFGKKTLGGEKENIETVKRISKNIFNLSPSDFEDRTSNSVVLNSSLTSFILKNIFKIKGRAENKEVPWIVYNVTPNLQFAFLQGCLLGDGSLNEANIVFNTSSPKLAQGIRFILLQNSIITSHSIIEPKKPNKKLFHHVQVCGKDKLLKTKSIWQNHYKAKITKNYLKKCNNTKRSFTLAKDINEDLGLLKIRSIKQIQPSKNFVYDFSVEGENFICGTGAICAHNTDEDREGEAIAFHIAHILKLDNPDRIVFHEITKPAIEKAIQNPRKINQHLVDAQQVRRILDRLVGYKLSPFLWKKIMRGLSAGRVQSVAVRLVCEREAEIKAFKPEEYWSIEAILKTKESKEFSAMLAKKDDKPITKLGIKTKKETEQILKALDSAEYKITSIERKETKRNPFPPFITSTLQQTASLKFGYGAKRTMMIAQKLYEKGFITYHRTDSLSLSQQSTSQAKTFIEKTYGKQYFQSRGFKTKSKSAQEAHEAVRPSYPEKTPDSLKLTPHEFKLYSLIWSRFIACQMTPAVFDAVAADISAKQYTFRANGQTLKFDGFLKVYKTKFEENELPPLEENEILNLQELKPEQHFTQPPARYSEATLIRALEKEGIGRPSTYAPIMGTIQARNYVEKNEQKKFQPTKIGGIVNDMMVKHFPRIVDIQFTAEMEKELDEIAEGKDTFVKTLNKFYTPFEKNLKSKEKTVEKIDLTEKTDKICPECGGPMVLRLGRYGKFFACSKFPNCKHTENLPKPSLGMKCPKCKKGDVVARRTKTKKVFYGCSSWPKCDFALWDKPIKGKEKGSIEKCSKCNSPLVKTKQKQIKCSNKECGYKPEDNASSA